jgi:hypothetical protein
MLSRALLWLFLVFACACEHAPRVVASGEGPSQLRPEANEVPAAVRAIEVHIDRQGALIADEIEIECSCNYVWDVALSGTDVERIRPDGQGQRSSARGQPRATFRNLELRAISQITLKTSGMNVAPYIRINAKGHAAYASSAGVLRAESITIDNAQLRSSQFTTAAPMN